MAADIVAGQAECGCIVEVHDDGVHVIPCTAPRHAEVLERCARDLCERHGIELSEVYDR